MKSFPANITFKYPWRNYQQRVLHELDLHLSNHHLHVVAPPGSGKTILGLEVMLRLNKPTLILAPSIAIRNQWVTRFRELFLQADEVPDWISYTIRNPKFLTVSTYQGLHAACSTGIEDDDAETDEEEEKVTAKPVKAGNANLKAVITALKAQGIETIVTDEAHHLKNEWWQTLTKVKAGLDPIIVGLTATPPYDVSFAEWNRYIALNGPVDAEITVPELVAEGDLCPHQDYVYFSLPNEEEQLKLNQYRNDVEGLLQQLKDDTAFVNAVATHPAWVNSEEHYDWIYDNLPCYSAILIFLNSAGFVIPDKNLEIIGNEKTVIPEMDTGWMETLLGFYLFGDAGHFTGMDAHKKQLVTQLKKLDAVSGKKVTLKENRNLTRQLVSSINKLSSIKEIAHFEYGQLGAALRMVILTDYIRKEFLDADTQNTAVLNKIGVIPVFEQLRRNNPDNIKLGVLTGSVVIIPASARQAFINNIPPEFEGTIQFEALPYDNSYLLVIPAERAKHLVTEIVTRIFQEGAIEVLTGTKSLLGEGWDAPAINALILASFVGSFVLSNQMRGRAIRSQRGNPLKTGNIWHLVSVDPGDPQGGSDFKLLQRRFKGFVGVPVNEEDGIENGTRRLGIPPGMHSVHDVTHKNSETLKHAADRKALKQKWDIAIVKGTNLTEEITMPFDTGTPGSPRTYEGLKELYYNRTIAYAMAAVFGLFADYFFYTLEALGRARVNSWEGLYVVLILTSSIFTVFCAKKVYRALRLYVSYRDITKDIHNIAEALLETFIQTGYITPRQDSRIFVTTLISRYGYISCYVEGGSAHDKSLFIGALLEIISPVDNPTYVIERKSSRFLMQQRDYHALPELLAKNKKTAEVFAEEWTKKVGRCSLTYTRNPEGRRMLLKARAKALSAQFTSREPEHISKWR